MRNKISHFQLLLIFKDINTDLKSYFLFSHLFFQIIKAVKIHDREFRM